MFPSLSDHCPVLSAVQNLKAVVSYILSDLLFVYSSRVNLVPVTPLWIDVEVPDVCVCTHTRVHFFSQNGNYVSSSLWEVDTKIESEMEEI